MQETETLPIGRPTKFKPEYSHIAHRMTLLGAIDRDLAQAFDVSESTINEWKLDFADFSESIKTGKEQADGVVAESLFKRAVGYSHQDVDIRTVALGNNQGSEIVITPIIKHYPPDTVAAIFWLKNRSPKNWRDRVEIKHDDPTANRLVEAIARHLLATGKTLEVEDKPQPIDV